MIEVTSPHSHPLSSLRTWTTSLTVHASARVRCHVRCVLCAVCQVAVPSEWQCGASEQLRELRRWQALLARRGPLGCICAACIRLGDQSAVTECEDDYADVVGGLPRLLHGIHNSTTATATATASAAAAEHSPAVLCWPSCPLCVRPMLFLLQLHAASGRDDGELSRRLLFFCCADEQCEAQSAQEAQKAQQLHSQQESAHEQQQQRRRWRVWRLTEPSDRPAAGASQLQRRPAGRVPAVAVEAGGRHVRTDEYGSGSQCQPAAVDREDGGWGISGEWHTTTDRDSSSRSDSRRGVEDDNSDANESELTDRLEGLILRRQHLAQPANKYSAQQRQTGAAAHQSTSAISTVPRQPRADAVSDRPGVDDGSGSAVAADSPYLSIRCARPFYLCWTVADSSNSGQSADCAEDSVVQRLLRQYQQQCSADERSEHLPSSPTVDAPYDNLADEYERSSGTSFARFRRHLSRQPQQRIRYQSTAAQPQAPLSNSHRDCRDNDRETDSDTDTDSDSENEELSGGRLVGGVLRDECLPADSRMRRGMADMARSVCQVCGQRRSFECQLLGSLVSDLSDVRTGQPIPLGWTTVALYTCRNAQCRVGALVDETAGLLIAS